MQRSSLDVSFPMGMIFPIMPLQQFNVLVCDDDYRGQKLNIVVTHSREILFAASQWMGAAMGCADTKTAGDKVQDIMGKLPCLRHSGGSLSDLTLNNVSQQPE